MSSTAHAGDIAARATSAATSPSAWSLGRRTRRWVRVTDAVALGLGVVAATLTAADIDPVVASVWGLTSLASLHALGLYRVRLLTLRIDEWRRIASAIGTAAAMLVVACFLIDHPLSRAWMLAVTLSTFAGLVTSREVWRLRLRRLRGAGTLTRRTVLVGSNPEADMLVEMLKDTTLGYEVVARVDPREHERAELLTTSVLATVAETDASSALIAGSGVEVGAFNRLCRDLIEAGVHVEFSMSLIDVMHHRLTLRPLGRFPVAYLEPVHRTGWRPRMKRTFDLIVAIVGLAAALPLFLVIAIAVRAGSKGPIIFRQERVGRDSKSFNMLKFRTMVADAEDQLDAVLEQSDHDGPLFKMRDDPRVTRVGRVLRRTSLDELPQLINVIAGDMSLVGPRPALRSEMGAWTPELYGRLRVRPGITGLWQVSGRSEVSFDEYTRLDLYYVDNWSLTTDLRILARTATAVLRSAGAY